MLNKLRIFLRQQEMVCPGDRVICAVSGGADSMALLWGMYLLREELQIQLSAAHFNHHLRAEESDRDSAFVQNFCRDYRIPCVVGEAWVRPGEKGLEAAAREARYSFFRNLSGKVATAHTADDNAETLLMHLIRGTGLKGLGGISPKRENLIRPMLSVTRQEVEAFLAEYSIPFVQDSSNATDAFLRNRIRHHVMPLLKEENPVLAENLSASALRLRQDEQALEAAAGAAYTRQVSALRALEPAVRSRVLARLLCEWGVKEPEAAHIAALQRLVDADNPSAKANFPGGITLIREYDQIKKADAVLPVGCYRVSCPGITQIPELGITLICADISEPPAGGTAVRVEGDLVVRSRQAGDAIRLSGGTKSLKKLFIDKKIPASQRCQIPVLADNAGVVGVPGIGFHLDRTENPNVCIRWEKNV